MSERDHASASDAHWIALVLRAGLFVSLVAMVIGIALAARHVPLDAVRMKPFELSFARHPGSTTAMIGVLVLGATPAVRVAALVVLWARERDRRFALTAAAVAAVLVLAALLGRG